MAIRTYEASYKKYFPDTYEKIGKDSTHDEVRQLYDEWAVKYDEQIGAAGAAFHKPLSDYMNSFVKESFPNTPKDQLKILDAGAGTGPIGIELDKLGYTCVHALDISEEMLNVARQKGVPYKRFICTALTEKRVCEVETGEFDIVIAAGALIMANVRPEALVEIVRMVKKGGLVCFSLRYNEVDHYEPKMTELEKEGIWEKLGSKKIPYFNQEDMPSYAYGFAYKVLKK
ncbi:Methyltransferase domain [Porites harrisoni]